VNVVKSLNAVSKIPEVLGAVLTDPSGILIESTGQMDGEVAGAIHAFTARALAQTGELLGLNNLERASLVADKSVCVLAVSDNSVLAAEVDPGKPLGAIEKKLWEAYTK
jgi:predicted regulator of Ras-like GTPase activity (Roadblock/LC7/MglB family)